MRFLSLITLNELLKAYKILDKAGADDKLTSIVFRELLKRAGDVGKETRQEVLQEAATIAGVQVGTKLDTGEWAYSFGDVTDRLWDTTKDSALTFTLTNVPSTVNNVTVQNHQRLVAAGEANILAGKMPTPEQLYAMNMSRADALGKMAVLQMGELNDSVDGNREDLISEQHFDGATIALNPNKIRFSQSSINGSLEIVESMTQNNPIDIVHMSDGGYTTIDNTRVLAARQAGISVYAKVYAFDELLPIDYIDRFTTKKGVPVTWGDAIHLRIGKQKASFRENNPFGALYMEDIK